MPCGTHSVPGHFCLSLVITLDKQWHLADFFVKHRFKLMHDKFVNDPLAGWTCIRLDRLQPGYRFIHLFNEKGVQTKGVILAQFNFDWKVRGQDSSTSKSETTLPLR